MQTPVHYSSDVEGGAPVQVRYAIAGRLNLAEYLTFVAERAHWLGLSGWAAAAGPQSVTVVAAGPEALVGALEMACTLGPQDALIEDLRATPSSEALPVGFRLR